MPRRSSRCNGTTSACRRPGFFKRTWLPRWRTTSQPSLRSALIRRSPETTGWAPRPRPRRPGGPSLPLRPSRSSVCGGESTPRRRRCAGAGGRGPFPDRRRSADPDSPRRRPARRHLLHDAAPLGAGAAVHGDREEGGEGGGGRGRRRHPRRRPRPPPHEANEGHIEELLAEAGEPAAQGGCCSRDGRCSDRHCQREPGPAARQSRPAGPRRPAAAPSSLARSTSLRSRRPGSGPRPE